MEPLLVHPDPAPAALAQALDLAGWAWKAVAGPDQAAAQEPEDGWAGAVVWALPATESRAGDLGPRGGRPEPGPDTAFALCRALRKRDSPLEPLLLMVGLDQLAALELREDLFDDLTLVPFHPAELEARLEHLFWRTGRGTRPELVEYGPLVLNLETYQAAVAGRPLDLTYMEYELLKFLAAHPTRVFTRETLLSRVWGYEYYGGARTVDVHIRRLRAKLGDQHAPLIHTVRSVGYRLGQPRWP
ncbi:MAG: winged helix-turn-helix domain-containing protein [Acidimicrobiales bacterium]